MTIARRTQRALARPRAVNVLAAAFVVACSPGGTPSPGGADTIGGDSARADMAQGAASADTGAMNRLTDAERAAGWRLLFDGRTTTGWRGYRSDSVPAAWTAENGTLTKSVSTEDLVTRDEFGDFELAFDWMLTSGGNAGVFYRGTEEYDHIYWSAPEYQLLDDAGHPDGKSRLTAAGSDFGLYPSLAGVVHPAGEWNSSRIVVRGAHVEHWLNGQKMLEYELWSPEWKAKVAASKFGAWPHYGTAKRGRIGIQGDHPGRLSLRNIKLRELP